VFQNWQIYLTPPGHAMTNSPIESFNNKLKKQFTLRNKYNLLPTIQLFESLVVVEDDDKFLDYAKPTATNLKIARELIRDECVEAINDNKCIIKIPLENNEFKAEVILDEFNTKCCCFNCCYCDCSEFLDKAMCDHLVAACLKLKFEYPNTYIKRAVMKKGKGRPRLASKALVIDD
jgi:hypothetical protein